jgi:recombination protein RecA
MAKAPNSATQKTMGGSLAQVKAAFASDFGDHVMKKGSDVPVVERLPSGWFELDYALGGGIPRGRVTEIYGAESSCKTNLALGLIRENQRLYPEQQNVFFNLEGTFDAEWAEIMGVDTSKLLLLEPEYAEQCVDMLYAVVTAKETGVVVLDSIAALITAHEVESSADKATPGGASATVNKMIRKVTDGIRYASVYERHPTIVLINQTRSKIGVMYGSPVTTPGGNAVKFAASLRLQTYGKDVIDNKVNDLMPIKKEVSITIVKSKVGIAAKHAVAEIVMVPHNGLKPGYSDCWSTVDAMMTGIGQFHKDPDKSSGWVFMGEKYNTKKEVREEFYADKAFQKSIINKLMGKAEEDALITVHGKGGKGEVDGEELT